jgi:hypothetical protein
MFWFSEKIAGDEELGVLLSKDNAASHSTFAD